MINCLIVGVGSIGIEHFKSCLNSPYINNIYLYDLNKKKLKKYIDNKKVFHLIKDSSIKIELAIISTNSKERFSEAKFIVKTIKGLKWIIFEKFLFNNLVEYKRMNLLLKLNNIKAFVNCTRRMFPSYLHLKEIVTKEAINMTIIGNNISMASNAIHFLDLFCFFNGDNLSISTKLLITRVLKSKRYGYDDFNGVLKGSIHKSSFCLIENSFLNQARIYLNYGKNFITIDEINSKIEYNLYKKQKFTKKFKFLKVCDTTSIIISELIRKNKCSLLSFNKSSKLHLKYLNSIKQNKFKINIT